MMSNQVFLFALSLGLWSFLGYRFLRAFGNRRLTSRASLYAWFIFFLCYFVVALDVPSLEAEINAPFQGLPVAALVRNELILITAQLFYLGTRAIDRPSKHIKHIFTWFNPFVIAFSTGLFAE